MVRRSVLAMFAALAIVLGGVVVSTPAGAVVDTAVVVPSPNVGTGNSLSSVSCVSSSWCVAVGSSGSGAATLVESWNALEWSVVPSPNVGTVNRLYSVSCVSPSWCVAVGNTRIAGGFVPLFEAWDGENWTVIPSPSIGGDGGLITSVSCVSPSLCVAVGRSWQGLGSIVTLVESWNGLVWSVVPSPNVGSTEDVLYSVSCVSSAWCVAVGWSQFGTAVVTLVESWNGLVWSVVPSPNVAGGIGTADKLLSVSCTSSSCVAVGRTELAPGLMTLVESWNGSVWSVVPSPDVAGGGISGELESVSCASSSSCVAAGLRQLNSNFVTLVESWNGSAWSVVPSPNVGNEDNWIFSLSCVSSVWCFAVGNSHVGSDYETLVLSLTGPEPSPTTTTTSSDPVAPSFAG